MFRALRLLRQMSSSVPQIRLNKAETQIVNLLNEYTRYFNEHKTSATQQPLELRITGGWVRDKLLGRESHDIDIGIDHLSGVEFVTQLHEYIKAQNGGKSVESGVYKIEKNPEKSKHLETCTTKLFGLSIDFVNLRSEKYAEDSRIPQIEVGTAEEDAFRRDATLNSLFYNLTTGQVEDFTGRGLQDLRDGVLRTPLDPRRTFLDDPLRCLRLIRFASTYNFRIDELALAAMREDDIKQKLREKISRERINVEFKKIVMGRNPVYGLRLIEDVGFYQLFECEQPGYESGNEAVKTALKELVQKYDSVEQELKNNETLNSLLEAVYASDISKQSLFLNLILYPWGDEKIALGKHTIPVPSQVVQDALKMQLKIRDLVGLCCSTLEKYNSAYRQWSNIARSEIATTLLIPYKEEWRLMLLTNIIVSIFRSPQNTHELVENGARFARYVQSQNLEDVHNTKLLLNGKEVAAALNRKPGPWLSETNAKLLTWQLDNPSCSKQDMEAYLLSISG
ncbi:hypothetical protein KL930_004296 [Ogataea haglerorum]|uniref:tRNA nucleotidyltransferase n=1 Tax=Ogataea haglerorum TaxID=1937702 RepID=A0ABQ7RBZ3_9ASCO|nr:uncharacterized protein KL911_004217 [Ogataea haglerorum]KAG7692947.1 hypothetical protein KL915_004403 [Ogataea haglerorum]KAG7704273.1 hypothetical protein KL914_004260 [Ogataea haglerorum]KAG7704458.1 hypothetical protein KL950_004265 [Ogataea haglerorum]KAG7738223.1 hypothetical protein KL932_003830 [Ogataea haglerorum]KAG7751971.1 hypothetical protein KL911_004217 [Ogataea haglerorum]